MIRTTSPQQSRKRRPSGTGMVEASFALILFLGFMLLTVNVCWGMFVKLTLQHAVRSAVRYAVTSQAPPVVGGASIGYVAAVKQIAQSESMGLLSNSDLSSYVTVTFFSVSSNPPTQVTGEGANSAGNMVVVSVNAWPLTPLAPLLISSDPVPINVTSADLIESIGNGSTPPSL
ncbi:MAG: TadE/TadG family type IV pilus assembly protein [Bryobacteraceae bacterium]|nr:TadE/TadG family type IV pilus assembly protein [Bryobacteraceae bacterium]